MLDRGNGNRACGYWRECGALTRHRRFATSRNARSGKQSRYFADDQHAHRSRRRREAQPWSAIPRVLAELPELEVVDLRFGPGFSVDPHTHQDHVDSFYVLEGEAEFTLGEKVVRADAGTWVSAPLGMLHGFRNAGEDDLRILNVHAPNTGFASRLREES